MRKLDVREKARVPKTAPETTYYTLVHGISEDGGGGGGGGKKVRRRRPAPQIILDSRTQKIH